MKRGRPLKRTMPLAVTKPMSRGAGLRAKAKRNSKQLPAPTKAQRVEAWESQGRLCPPCGRPVELAGAHAHHRLSRVHPGCTNDPVNLVVAHPLCHVAAGGPLSIHGGPARAAAMGWTVRSLPETQTVPVRISGDACADWLVA